MPGWIIVMRVLIIRSSDVGEWSSFVLCCVICSGVFCFLSNWTNLMPNYVYDSLCESIGGCWCFWMMFCALWYVVNARN